MKYFKVRIGFGHDEYISIREHELQKAFKAQVMGGVVIFEGGSVAGNNIISITPDFNRELGLNRDYKLSGEDYRCLPPGKVERYRLAITEASETVQREIKGLPPLPKRDQLGAGVQMVEDITSNMRIDHGK